MRVYVAGGFVFKPEVQRIQSVLKRSGHVITHDWTTTDDDGPLASAEVLRLASENDLNGVATANAVVLVLNDADYEYRGTFCELGAALALGKKVILLDTVDGLARFRQIPFYWDARADIVYNESDMLTLMAAHHSNT